MVEYQLTGMKEPLVGSVHYKYINFWKILTMPQVGFEATFFGNLLERFND